MSSECAHFIKKIICSSPQTIEKMIEFCKQEIGQTITDHEQLLTAMKTLLNVETESGILSHPKFEKYIGRRQAETEKNNRLLPYGPKDNTGLLDNFNIDETLDQFAVLYPEFLHINFQMIDFEKMNTELAKFHPGKMGSKTKMGSVLNTDVSSGYGKHWFCIFFDLNMRTLEYFNSSGNPPHPLVHKWLVKTLKQLHDIGKPCKLIRAAPYQLQYDNHSCGVYCLAYMYYRLQGKKPNWFAESGINDRDMVEFRKVLFRKHK